MAAERGTKEHTNRNLSALNKQWQPAAIHQGGPSAPTKRKPKHELFLFKTCNATLLQRETDRMCGGRERDREGPKDTQTRHKRTHQEHGSRCQALVSDSLRSSTVVKAAARSTFLYIQLKAVECACSCVVCVAGLCLLCN